MDSTTTPTILAIGAGIVVLFLVFLAIGMIPRVRSNNELKKSVQDAKNSIPAVYVIHAQPAVEAGLSLAATTQAIQDSIIYARATGYISKRYADIGDHVNEGQLLAEIAAPDLDRQLDQAEADLEQSRKNLDLQKANLELARVTMDRYQGADMEGAVAKLLLDQAVSTYRTTQAAVAAAAANVQSNQANVRRLEELTSFERVVAPFNGTVIQRNFDIGALITAGSPVNNTAAAPSSLSGTPNGLYEVAYIEALRVFVNVPQPFATNVKAGMPVQVSVRGQLMQPSMGAVTRTASGLDPGTRTLLTQVDIPNRSHRLLPGMFVYVDFKIAPAGTRWRVPATAVMFNAQGTRVVTVGQDNKLHFQQVELGRDFGMSIDVQAGLNGTETIVKQPTVSLEEGQVVRPLEAQDSSWH